MKGIEIRKDYFSYQCPECQKELTYVGVIIFTAQPQAAD